MKTVAIIQSRLGSTRLPRKALATIHGLPMIERVVVAVSRLKRLDAVVLATTRLDEDTVLADVAKLLRIPVFRGSSDDVLGRFHSCAQAFEADVILRVTGDCPLWDSYSGAIVLQTLLDGNADYVANLDRATDGWDAEVFTARTLRVAHIEATTPYDREHVTSYIRASGRFDVERIVPRRIPGGAKWSVDTAEDLARVRAVFQSREGS